MKKSIKHTRNKKPRTGIYQSEYSMKKKKCGCGQKEILMYGSTIWIDDPENRCFRHKEEAMTELQKQHKQHREAIDNKGKRRTILKL